MSSSRRHPDVSLSVGRVSRAIHSAQRSRGVLAGEVQYEARFGGEYPPALITEGGRSLAARQLAPRVVPGPVDEEVVDGQPAAAVVAGSQPAPLLAPPRPGRQQIPAVRGQAVRAQVALVAEDRPAALVTAADGAGSGAVKCGEVLDQRPGIAGEHAALVTVEGGRCLGLARLAGGAAAKLGSPAAGIGGAGVVEQVVPPQALAGHRTGPRRVAALVAVETLVSRTPSRFRHDV